MPEKKKRKKKSGHGRALPGAVRPKGAKGAYARNVTMRAIAWRLVDDELAATVQKRLDFFEALVREKLS